MLIENQLERTDHTHLGQLLTYASGLHAATVVWIAQRFTEEHRAALDWLNEITSPELNFFGLEIELWQIGNSDKAPRFNVVAQPNDWTRAVRRDRATKGEDAVRLEYWREFRELVKQQAPSLKPGPATDGPRLPFPVGSADFVINALNTHRDRGNIGVEFQTKGSQARENYLAFKEDASALEREIGKNLQWVEHVKKWHFFIRTSAQGPLDERGDWPHQQSWMLETVQQFHDVFARRIGDLELASDDQ